MMMSYQDLLLVATVLFTITTVITLIHAKSPSSISSLHQKRDLSSLFQWAKQEGITMHDNLEWKQYQEGEDDNWGLELSGSVSPGTTLLKVPNDIVLDSNCIRDELKSHYGEERLEKGLQKLGDTYRVHEDGFFIFLKLFRCLKEAGDNDDSNSKNKWFTWIKHGLPKKFTYLTKAEIECLPFYANYAASYQNKKFEAFCEALLELGEWDGSDSYKDRIKWAFHAFNSRFWKTAPINKDEAESSELVPIGDMFNHREPANVAVTHENGCVNFIYKGDPKENNKDLYVSYGQPNNAHRFLAIFGFVPSEDSMKYVWCHIAYGDNPFSANVPKMVFRVKDGMIPKIVWDAVLYALLQPERTSDGIMPVYTKDQHEKYKKFTIDVLRNHISRELKDLASLRQKIDSLGNDNKNIGLIRRHNEFLTTVFSRVQKYLENEGGINFEAEL